MLMDPSRAWSVSRTGCARTSAAAGFAFGSRLSCPAFKGPVGHACSGNQAKWPCM